MCCCDVYLWFYKIKEFSSYSEIILENLCNFCVRFLPNLISFRINLSLTDSRSLKACNKVAYDRIIEKASTVFIKVVLKYSINF